MGHGYHPQRRRSALGSAHCLSPRIKLTALPAVALSLAALVAPATATATASADTFNPANQKHNNRCVSLRDGLTDAPALFPDGNPTWFTWRTDATSSPLGPNLAYQGTPDPSQDKCNRGQVRIDAHEIVKANGRRFYFMRGGDNFARDKQRYIVKYGHIWIADLKSGTAPATSRLGGTGGQPCAASTNPATEAHYYLRVKGIDLGLKYKKQSEIKQQQKKKNKKANKYSTYQTYGNYPDRDGDRTGAPHSYLLWTWMRKADDSRPNNGGGMVRALIRDGQVFHRCDVASIRSSAFKEGGNRPIGWVKAVYGKISTGDQWLYGWVVDSHRRTAKDDGTAIPVKQQVTVYHRDACPSSGCVTQPAPAQPPQP